MTLKNIEEWQERSHSCDAFPNLNDFTEHRLTNATSVQKKSSFNSQGYTSETQKGYQDTTEIKTRAFFLWIMIPYFIYSYFYIKIIGCHQCMYVYVNIKKKNSNVQ